MSDAEQIADEALARQLYAQFVTLGAPMPIDRTVTWEDFPLKHYYIEKARYIRRLPSAEDAPPEAHAEGLRDWWDVLTAEEFARRLSQWLINSRGSRDAQMLSQALRDFPNPITPGHGVGEWGIEWEEIKAMCKRFGAVIPDEDDDQSPEPPQGEAEA